MPQPVSDKHSGGGGLIAVRQDIDARVKEEAFDPKQNIPADSKSLKQLIDR